MYFLSRRRIVHPKRQIQASKYSIERKETKWSFKKEFRECQSWLIPVYWEARLRAKTQTEGATMDGSNSKH